MTCQFCWKICSTRPPCTRIYRRLSMRPKIPHRHHNTDVPCSVPFYRDEPSNPLVAAEQEWLQAEIITVVPDTIESSPSSRFDWRLRAPPRSPAITLDPQSRYSVKRLKPQLVDVQNGEFYFDEIQSYQEKYLSLLAAEQAQDEAILKHRLSTWSVERLKKEGYCLTGLSTYWLQANQFGRPVAAFLLGPGIALPDHRFENGIQVLVSHCNPLQEESVKGSVVSRTATHIKISFQERFDLEGSWRLDVGRSDIVYERMRTAIRQLHLDPMSQESAPQAIDRQLILQGTHLRDVILRAFSAHSCSMHHEPISADRSIVNLPKTTPDHEGAFKDDARIMSWARRYSEMEPIRIDGDPVLTGLNSTQIRAIAMMIGERISLLQGPPGTGKTKTIIEAVNLLKVHFEVPHPILVCTYTNVAVDNLVEGLYHAGVKPLRVGFGGKVRSSLLEHTLDYKLEEHPLKPEIDELSKKQEELQKCTERMCQRLRKCDDNRSSHRRKRMQISLVSLERRLGALNASLYARRQAMLRSVVLNADVICTTCITSACVALNAIDFPVVFLDEASMSTEPASLIPIMKGSRHVALIGDHKQLPPVIASREARAMGLGVSLFERLTEEAVVPSIMLDVQYRMHPMISKFPASEFYNFRLRDGTVDSSGNIPSGLRPPVSRHLLTDSGTEVSPSVVFLDHAGSESRKGRSWVNADEAHIVCSLVEDLLLHNEHLRGHDIGIIAPYVAQISLLTRSLNADVNFQKRFKTVLGDHRAMQVANIEIKTVDGFEGREKDVIIFSTVRNNTTGHIGFLGDRRRLNVGLTRAKRGLFVIGSLNTLKTGKVGARLASQVGRGGESLRRYAQFLSDEGLVIQLYGDKLRTVLYGTMTNSSAGDSDKFQKQTRKRLKPAVGE